MTWTNARRLLPGSALLALLLGLMVVSPAVAQQSADEWLERCRSRTYTSSRATHCEVREHTVRATGSFEVNARPNGGISVQAWDGSEVLVRARLQAHAESDGEARRLAGEVEVRVAPGSATANGPRARGREGWSVSFDVFVPRDTHLTLESTNGGIDVSSVHGRHVMSTTNGGIAMRGVAGDIRGHTTNGGITVHLTGRGFSGEGLDLRTTNGGITLQVPEGFSAQLEASTVNGGIDTQIPMTVQGRIGRSVSAQLGSGGPPVRLRTTNGGITIRRGG
jgi:hypothetical protein